MISKMKLIGRRPVCAALALALTLGGCSGGPPVPLAQKPAGLSLKPVIDGAQAGTTLQVRLNLPAGSGLRTKALSFVFDHAQLELSGPLLAQPRAADVLLTSSVQAPAVVTTVAGGSLGTADGQGAAAQFNFPQRLAVTPQGTIYVADTNNHLIRTINGSGQVTTVAGGGTDLVGGTGTTARFFNPTGIDVDARGDLFVADLFNHRIRKINADRVVSTVAGDGTFGLLDGTGTGARLRQPRALVVDPQGVIYVADEDNQRIRKINTDGTVVTIAGGGTTGVGLGSFLNGIGTSARFSQPSGIARDAPGNLYVADLFNHRIRKIDTGGNVTTFAGDTAGFANGSGTAARFTNPGDVDVDAFGNVYVGDAGNHAIRKITPDRVVSTLAGGAGPGSSDGTGTGAHFNGPTGVAVMANGDLLVADMNNSAIRRLTIPPPAFNSLFANLRPGSGYTLKVALFDAPDPNGRVVASGNTPVTLFAGSNAVSIDLGQTAEVTAPSPLPLTFSETFANSTANRPDESYRTVIVGGDTVRIYPGLSDPRGQVGRVELFLAPDSNPSGGNLLATWYGDGLGEPLFWDTSQPLDQGAYRSFGTVPENAPVYVTIAAPTPVADEGNADLVLRFVVYDRNAPPGNGLIGSFTYGLAVVQPLAINVGLQ